MMKKFGKSDLEPAFFKIDNAIFIEPSSYGAPVIANGHVPLAIGEPLICGRLMMYKWGLAFQSSVSLTSLGYSTFDQNYISFYLPIHSAPDVQLNGCDIVPSAFHLCLGGRERFLRGGFRTSIIVAFQKAKFAQTVANHAGVYEEDVKIEDGTYLLPPEVYKSLKKYTNYMLNILEAGHCSNSQINAIGKKYMNYWADVFIITSNNTKMKNNSNNSNFNIMKRATFYIDENIEPTPNISAICSAIGVSKSVLFTAFQDVVGQSPGKFILRKRLVKARLQLLNSDRYPGAITQIASDEGFLEWGRFAHYYRRQFGELPSDTLARASNIAAAE